MGSVVPHPPEQQVSEAQPKHLRRPRAVAREHGAGKSAHSAGANSVGPDGVPVELFKIALNGDPTLLLRLLVGIWRGGDVPQQWKGAIIKVLHKKRVGQSAATTGVSHW